jgi:enamine deaminase RidA (YjgF/YER057c/UK114 family)
MRDVVRLQTFLTGTAHIAGFMKARAEAFARYFPDGVYPTNTLVIVSALVRPELVVEVEAMAVKPARAAAPMKRPAPAKRSAARQARRRSRR